MGLLDSCSTSPVTMRGIVMMNMNMAEDGGAICHLLRDEATLRCTKSSDHFFTLDIPDPHSRVYVRNNTALGGGGVAFARCLQHHLSAPGNYNFCLLDETCWAMSDFSCKKKEGRPIFDVQCR